MSTPDTAAAIPSLGKFYELEDELRSLRSAVWRIVHDVDESHMATTEGGDRFMLTDLEAEAVQRALAANEPGGERLQRGCHDLGRITWDAVANWQCSLCHRVFEFPSEADDDPCDVRPDPGAEGERT